MNTKTALRIGLLATVPFLGSEQIQRNDTLSINELVAAPISLDEDETGSSLSGKPSPEEELLKEEKVLQAIVDQFLPKIMKEQEEKLGISYLQRSFPILPYQDPEQFLFLQIPESFVLPNIDFYVRVDDIEELETIARRTLAFYNPRTDTIHLHRWEYYRNYGRSVCPESSEQESTDESGFPLQYQNLKKIVKHELGHFYTDNIHESLGLESWPLFDEGEAKASEFRKRLISEGIAEYFGRTTDNDTEFKDGEWPASLDAWTVHTIYDGGYHLVKPIIDQYGEEGIEYLIIHLPDGADLENIPAYQQKVLQDLEKSKSLSTP